MAWLPVTSIVVLPARLAMKRSRSGLISRSCVATALSRCRCDEREVSAPHGWSGRCDCIPPRGHRDTAKCAVRLGGDEMALDVEGVVDGGVCGKKFLG